MVQQKQPSQEELRQMQQFQNQNFMSYSYEQPIMANSENGTEYRAGRTINFTAPTISGSYATRLVLRHSLKIIVEGVGTAKTTASFPEGVVNNIEVTFGNKQISMHPVIARIQQQIQGFNRVGNHQTVGAKSQGIEDLLNKVPVTFPVGEHDLVFDTDVELNALHPASVNGILPLFSTGTRLQVAAVLPGTVAGVGIADPLDNVFEVEEGTTVKIEGKIEVIVMFRDYTSMSDGTQPVSPNIEGLPTVQVIQLPSITGLSPKTYNYASFRNPYRFAKIFHILIDGKQSEVFSKAENIVGYELSKAENSNSAFFKYDNEIGMATYFKETRARFGQDIDKDGVIVFDATTANQSNVSSKLGTAYLNLDASKGGYSAARFGFKFDTVGENTGIAPRIISYGVLLNDDGVRAL